MNVEQLRESGWIIRECIVGSHLYRTNKEGSDVDVKGVYIQPTEQILGGRYIPQISDDKNDCTYYEVGRFIELLENGNFELNFTHDRCIKAGLYNDGFMLIRGSAELQNKAFYLSSFYDWEIVIDSEKIKCLVPTKKKV